MTGIRILLFGSSLLSVCLILACQNSQAQPGAKRVVRIAELEIDPAQLNAFQRALVEEIEVSIRVEPGVLALWAVSIKGHPEQIRLFETYRDTASYQSPLQTPHFKKYKTLTQGMVKGLTLLEREPLLLGTKPDHSIND